MISTREPCSRCCRPSSPTVTDSYAAATGLTFAATALSSVIQPVFGTLTDRRNLC